jgi:ferredoxin
MKVEVFDDLCISCGVCISTCPDLFEWGEDDKAIATSYDVPKEKEQCAVEAVESCPTAAIKQD